MWVVKYEFSTYSVITKLSFSFDSDIDIQVTGLGIFDWLVSTIISWVTDLFHGPILGLLESQLRTVIEELLPNIELPIGV
jgi:hypothetical protein